MAISWVLCRYDDKVRDIVGWYTIKRDGSLKVALHWCREVLQNRFSCEPLFVDASVIKLAHMIKIWWRYYSCMALNTYSSYDLKNAGGKNQSDADKMITQGQKWKKVEVCVKEWGNFGISVFNHTTKTAGNPRGGMAFRFSSWIPRPSI